MLKFLIEAFKASKGRMPNNMEMILLRQKAAKQSVDERKVVSMFDRSAINPNKPIMGGKNIPETEDDIRRRLMKQNEEGIASMRSKLDDPEKKAMGGRIGYAGGSDMGTVADSKGNVGPSKGGYQGGGTGPVERPSGGGRNDNNTTYDYTIPKQIVKQTAINTVKNLGRRELMNTLGLAKFSNPIGIAIALKGLYDQTQNPTLTEEEATSGGIGGMGLGYASGGRIGLKDGEGVITVDDKIDEMISFYKDYLNQGGKMDFKTFSKKYIPENFANGGRIGYKFGAGKKGVESLIDLVRNKFGKKSITTADKAPIPPKTLERDMFKTTDNRINKKEGVFMEDGKTPDYDYYKEILDDAEDSMGFNVAGDETIEELLKREKTLKDYEAEMFAEYKSIGGSKRLGGPNDPMADAIDNASPGYTGDIKYDAQLVADDLAEKMFQMEYDDLTQAQQMDLYDKAYTSLSKQRGEFQKISKPEKTLQSMKEGKGIDISDPEIADEFGRFMKEKDPKGYKELEQKIELSNFNPKDRKKNADGGIMRSAYAGGGMGRRGFLKLLGGVGAGIAAAKTGLLKLAGKEPAKQVAKEVVKGTAGTYPPPYFFKLAEKIKFMGDDVTKGAATQEREVVTSYKDYMMTEDLGTGNIVIRKRNEGVFYDQDGIVSDEYIVYKPGQADELTKGKKPPPEYDEYTVRPDGDGKLIDSEDGLDNLDEILNEVGDSDSMTLKKASGGIARMLGE